MTSEGPIKRYISITNNSASEYVFCFFSYTKTTTPLKKKKKLSIYLQL